MLGIICTIGDDSYAIDSRFVIDIFPNVHLKKLAHVPLFFTGLLDYGDDSYPVIDLSHLLYEKKSKNALYTRILFLELKISDPPLRFGLICENATEIVRLNREDCVALSLKIESKPFLKEVYRIQNKIINLIDLESLIKFVKESVWGDFPLLEKVE